MNFPVKPVLDEIEKVAGLGFDYLELAMDPPMAHYSILSSQKNDINRSLEDNNLGLVCHLPTFVSTADLTESLREASVAEMRFSLDVAVELGAMKVIFHPSMVSGMGSFVLDTVKEHAFEFLSEMVTVARSLDMPLCLENMFPRNLLGVEPDDFEYIFKVFPSLKLALDTGHANIDDQRGRRLKRFVEQLGKRIAHLHFSDNQGSRDEHLAIGKGVVNFNELVKRLKAVGYNETLTFEVFDQDSTMLTESLERIKMMFAGN